MKALSDQILKEVINGGGTKLFNQMKTIMLKPTITGADNTPADQNSADGIFFHQNLGPGQGVGSGSISRIVVVSS